MIQMGESWHGIRVLFLFYFITCHEPACTISMTAITVVIEIKSADFGMRAKIEDSLCCEFTSRSR